MGSQTRQILRRMVDTPETHGIRVVSESQCQESPMAKAKSIARRTNQRNHPRVEHQFQKTMHSPRQRHHRVVGPTLALSDVCAPNQRKSETPRSRQNHQDKFSGISVNHTLQDTIRGFQRDYSRSIGFNYPGYRERSRSQRNRLIFLRQSRSL